MALENPVGTGIRIHVRDLVDGLMWLDAPDWQWADDGIRLLYKERIVFIPMSNIAAAVTTA